MKIKQTILFLFLLFFVPIVSANQVILISNSSGVTGEKAQLASDTCCDSENQIPSASKGTSTPLTGTELNYLSSNDSTTSEVTQAGSASKDERININFTLGDVNTVNYVNIVVMLRRTGANDETRIGLYNYSTGLYRGVNTISPSTSYQAFTYNISSASEKTAYLQLNNNILNFSVVGWGYGGSSDSIATTYFEATVNYNPVLTDTSFTVTLPYGSTQAYFNATSKTQSNVGESSQNSSQGFLRFDNTGNVAENFNINYTSTLPTGVTLKADTDNNPTGATTLTTSLQQIITGLAVSSSQDVWLWADYTNVAPMNEQRTLWTNSST